MSQNALTITLTVIGLTLNAAGLAFVATQVALARRQLEHLQRVTEAEVARGKRQAAIDFYMGAAPRIAAWRKALPNDWDKPAIEKFVRAALADPDHPALQDLAAYLGFFEALAVSVSSDVYDLAVLDAIAGSRICNIATNYRTFFEHRRREAKADSAYRELEWLCRRIQELRGI